MESLKVNTSHIKRWDQPRNNKKNWSIQTTTWVVQTTITMFSLTHKKNKIISSRNYNGFSQYFTLWLFVYTTHIYEYMTLTSVPSLIYSNLTRGKINYKTSLLTIDLEENAPHTKKSLPSIEPYLCLGNLLHILPLKLSFIIMSLSCNEFVIKFS